MPKVIIFDADGMIIHSQRLSDRLIKEFGAPAEAFGQFFGGPFQECVVGNADLKVELAKALPSFGWKGSVDELLAYWFEAQFNVLDERFKKVVSDLREQGFVCALATNNEKYRMESLNKMYGINTWFDKIFASGHMGAKKPESAFFDQVCQDLKVKPEEVDFWDDDPENIAGAKVYGLRANLYTSLEEFTKHYARKA